MTPPSRAMDDAAWALHSERALAGGNLAQAVGAIEQALALAPDCVRWHVQHARCLMVSNRSREARGATDRALELGVHAAEELAALASVLTHCEAFEQARTLYERALAVDPASLEAMRGLIAVQRFLGRLDEAETLCDTFIAAAPDDAEIVHLRSSLRRQTASRNHVDDLRQRLQRPIVNWREQVHLRYALAKELEDLGQHEQSFAQLEQGATLRRRQTVYDVQSDVAIFGAIKSAFAAVPAAGAGGDPGDAPIFIVGMPRSGTTLVERIIASHSDVHAAGERQDFATELMALVGQTCGENIPRLDIPARSLAIDFRALGANYLRATRDAAGGAKHFTDKLPLNFLYVGHIRRALPNARIVHVVRDPVDSCYAMYKHLFAQAYPFSYDQQDLGHYYRAYRDLMAFWEASAPGHIVHVEYERLVADQEGETHRLLAALGLDWQDGCLKFHQSAAASTTGSAAQIRQPIYSTSIQSWRRYETQLAPLRHILGGAPAPSPLPTR